MKRIISGTGTRRPKATEVLMRRLPCTCHCISAATDSASSTWWAINCALSRATSLVAEGWSMPMSAAALLNEPRSIMRMNSLTLWIRSMRRIGLQSETGGYSKWNNHNARPWLAHLTQCHDLRSSAPRIFKPRQETRKWQR